MAIRVTQNVDEAAILPSAQNARTSQNVVEANTAPNTAQVNARTSQAIVEAAALPSLQNARVTQYVIELCYLIVPSSPAGYFTDSATSAPYFAF
jgi:hypothetical protein